jgi:recombination protein RecT
MSQELTTLKQTLNSEAMREQFARALPSHLSAERFCRIAITAVSKTPKLAECTQASLMRCLLDLSALGLEPDGRLAHLIPYGKECTLLVDYKGMVDLARRSGVVIRAETVCENDEFSWENGIVTHKIDWRKPRGEVQAVYAEGRMKDGEVQTATMTKVEVEAIRKRSKSGNNGPWATDWAEMAKKTAVRRLAKMLPLSPEFREAMEKDDDKLIERDVTPAVVPPVKALFAPTKPEKEKPAPKQAQERSTHETLADWIESASETWERVAVAANEGGLFVDTETPLAEQPADVVASILESWPMISGMLKGGAK